MKNILKKNAPYPIGIGAFIFQGESIGVANKKPQTFPV